MGWWTNIIGGDGRRNRAPRADELGLLSYKMFQRELHRQRAMSDRSGGSFALVVFGGSAAESAGGHAKLAAVISSRVRLSDVGGEYDEQARIGVILPDTDAKGAGLFIEAVEALLRREMNGRWRPESKLHCEVSIYPQVRTVVTLGAESKSQDAVATGKY